MRFANRPCAFVALLGAAVLAAGCDLFETPSSAGASAVEGARKLQAVSAAANQAAVQPPADHAGAARGVIVKEMQDELTALDLTLQQLLAQLERSTDEARASGSVALVALRAEASRIRRELEKVTHAGEDAWQQVRAGLEKSHEELKRSVARARARVGEKIAPGSVIPDP